MCKTNELFEIFKDDKDIIDILIKMNSNQLNEICKGLNSNLDVRQYINLCFKKSQMKQIRLGLLKKIDVSIYNNINFNSHQMKEIRLGLERGVDVSIYAKYEFNEFQMRFIRKFLIKGINYSDYIIDIKENNKLLLIERLINMDFKKLEEVKYLSLEDLKILTKSKFESIFNDYLQKNNLKKSHFNSNQIEQIKLCIFEGFKDYDLFINPLIDFESIALIRKGLQKGLDVALYSDLSYNFEQKLEIYKGLNFNLDITLYADKNFNYRQMREIRYGLKSNLNVRLFTYKEFNHKQMKNIRESLENKTFKRKDYFKTKIIDGNITYIPKKNYKL